MLLGEYEHTIDEKNRLTLPARFRKELAGGLVVTRGLDRCLDAFPRDSWEERVRARLSQLDSLSQEARVMRRFFYSGAVEAEPDKQGRVMIPAALLAHAGLGRDVVIAGVDDHLEIWDRAAWREHLTQIEGSAEHVAERLASGRD
jgi:transcriptional regulator MraZ